MKQKSVNCASDVYKRSVSNSIASHHTDIYWDYIITSIKIFFVCVKRSYMSTDTTKHLMFLGDSQLDLFCHKKNLFMNL